MASVEQISKQEPEQIRQQIVETRTALVQKLENLESEVKGTVEVAKQSVQEKVDDVKKAFDVRERIRERPLTFLGASLLVGAGAAFLFFGGSRKVGPALRRRLKERASALSVDGPSAKGILTGIAVNILQDAARAALSSNREENEGFRKGRPNDDGVSDPDPVAHGAQPLNSKTF